MIEHWISHRGRRAIERMGWPEWGGELGRYRLLRHDTQTRWVREVYSCLTRHWLRDAIMSERESLAILRDHAREWLWRSEIYLIPDSDLWRARKGSRGLDVGRGVAQTDYDACLIAAVLATGE